MPIDPPRLLFVSSNLGKVREVEEILGRPVTQLALDLPEVQALEVEAVVADKARRAYEVAGEPVLVEDTGLYIDALRGLPGAFVRWFLMTIGPAGICDLIHPDRDRAATARSAVAFCAGEDVEVFTGETRGAIVMAPRGEGGFGWDPIFQPDGSALTFAEMDLAEKLSFSMRRRALEHLGTRMNW